MPKAIEELTVQETVRKIEHILNENPAPLQGVQAAYQYDITDEEYSFQLHIKDGVAKVLEEFEERAECVILISYPNFKKMLLGKFSGTAAFMMGKLKVKGDVNKALKVESLLREYDMAKHFNQ